MTKKSWILAFLILLLFGFVVGYVTMTLDIQNGILGQKNDKPFLQILSPF